MKNFDTKTVFENNNTYIFEGERISFNLADTTRLEEKIYRAIYPSSKTWLETAVYLKDLSNVTIDFGGATLYLEDDSGLCVGWRNKFEAELREFVLNYNRVPQKRYKVECWAGGYYDI